MTVEEYVTKVEEVTTALKTNMREVLPAECNIVNRFILSGVTTEADWIAGLRVEDNIRILVILMSEQSLGTLGQTAGARNFNPIITFNLELYHKYEMGIDTDNTETVFRGDVSRIIYGLGKFRTFAGHAVINRSSLRMGLRPSSVQAMHIAKGEVLVDLRDIRFQ